MTVFFVGRMGFSLRKILYHNVAEDSHLYRWGMNAASTEFTQVIEGGQLEIFEL